MTVPPRIVKREIPLEQGASWSGQEPNNVCSHVIPNPAAAFFSKQELQENSHTAEVIQPDQQRILSETLESAGLAHYPVLPLCPIKEEDIKPDQHVVIELEPVKAKDGEALVHDRSPEGASVCMVSDRGVQQWLRNHAQHHGPGQNGQSPSLTFVTVPEYGVYEPRFQQFRDLAFYPASINENMTGGLSSSPVRPRREIKKPLRFLEVTQKFD